MIQNFKKIENNKFKKLSSLLFIFLIACSSANEPTQSIAEEENKAVIETTTTLFVPNFGNEFYSAKEISIFTLENDKQLFEQYFIETVLDSSTTKEHIFYEITGYGLDGCKELLFDDFEEQSSTTEEQEALTEEYCKRIVELETKKIFAYPLLKNEINNACKNDFNSYMNDFIEHYIENNTWDREWFQEDSWVSTTEFIGIGVENQDIQFISFVIDIFPAGVGAYAFHDWFEVNYDFVNCAILDFEDLITVPPNYLEIFPNLNNYNYEITEATLIAHILDLGVCGEDNLFCNFFYQANSGEYKSYSPDFLFNNQGIIVNIGNYFVHRTPNYRFIPWEELEAITTEFLK